MKSKFSPGPTSPGWPSSLSSPWRSVAYFAFTDNSGAFTLDNLAYAAEYWPVLLRSVLYAVAACAICLVVGYPVAMSSPSPRSARSACSTCW